MPSLVTISNLALAFPSGRGRWRRVVDGVSLAVERGQSVGVVGESGCGKSLSAMALIGLLPDGGRIDAGEITVAGVDVTQAEEAVLTRMRGSVVGMVFQEPGRSLNPVRSMAYQVTEAVRLRKKLSKKEQTDLAITLLNEVGLEEPASVARGFPHQLSGGQRQRALLAAALAGDPELLIADEPSSALDPISLERLIDLLARLRAKRHLALLVISHDLGLMVRLAEVVVVIHAGETVEIAGREEIFSDPLHPYTRALLETTPKCLTASGGSERFPSIPGHVPRIEDWGTGCRFAPRCPKCMPRCHISRPALVNGDSGRAVRCFLFSEREEETHA